MATGAYTADRAAALSGVPRSTVYNWARSGLLPASVSPTKIQLWSYTDLLSLRIIYWLRQPKGMKGGVEIPTTIMTSVRMAIDKIRRMDLQLWTQARSYVVVDRAGHIIIKDKAGLQTPSWQLCMPELLSVTDPFDRDDGISGPDLVQPRPTVRIHPGKLSGSPHIVDTRIETCVLSALNESGFTPEKISTLYPYLSPKEIAESIDLEWQLNSNLSRSA